MVAFAVRRFYRGLGVVDIGAISPVCVEEKGSPGMSRKILAVFSLICGVVMTSMAAPAAAAPTMVAVVAVPGRTEIAYRSTVPGVRDWGTPNQFQRRSGLSILKLYIVDYALRHGDGSASDRALAERMIRFSDDGAADRLSGKYPRAIAATAAEYHLTATFSPGYWGHGYTSVADVADFLRDKVLQDPRSPILPWMAAAGRVAADGTHQNWGTCRLPGVQGTKWGWSNYGPQQVASASYGAGFTIAAQTMGSPAAENADVGRASGSWLG